MENQHLLEGKSSSSKFKITIELTALLYLVGSIISQNLQLNLLLHKACRVYNARDDYCETELDSEIIISQINTWKLIFSTIFTVIFTSIVGPFIDRNPKQIPYMLMIPIVGQLICDIGNYLSVHFWSWHPSVNAIIEAVSIGFSGSCLGFMMICVSYISYISTKQDRTIRIGLFYFCLCVGLSLGYFCGGYGTHYLGYRNGFIVCWILYILAVVIGFKRINTAELPEKGTEEVTIFHIMQQNFAVLTKERKNGKQLVIILCLVVFPLASSYPLGEMSVLYLFLRRRFGWDAVEYGVYMSYKMIVKCLGALLCTELLKRTLKLHDATIGIIGCGLQVAMYIGWILIYYSWQVYAITVMGIFEKAILTVLTSLASKCVEPYEYGRLTSLFALTYILTPLVYPIYNKVYESEIYSFPSSIFLISLSLTAPCLLIFCILRIFSEKMRKKEIPQRLPE